MNNQNSHHTEKESFNSHSILHKVEQNTLKKFKSARYLLIFVLIILIPIAIFLYRSLLSSSNQQITENTSQGNITRYDDIPEEIKSRKTYREVDMDENLKIHTRGNIQELLGNNNFRVEFDTGETLTVKITENTTIGDAWVEVHQREGYTKTSFDLVDAAALEKLSQGDRVEIFYDPETIEDNEVEANIFVNYE